MGAERFTALTKAVSSQAFAQPEGKAGEQKVTDACIAGAATIRKVAVLNLARMTGDDGFRAASRGRSLSRSIRRRLRDAGLEGTGQRFHDA